MFGGVLGAAILGNLDGDMGLAGWRWLFIIEGTITIGIALIACFVLPNYPATTSWLSEEEKDFAAWRLLADIDEEDERHSRSVVDGLKLALKDYRLYLFVLFQHISLLSQTFQYFFPAIVGTLGYGSIDTLWLTAPVWVSNPSRKADQTPPVKVQIADHDTVVRNLPLLDSRHVELRTDSRSIDPHHLPDAHRRGW